MGSSHKSVAQTCRTWFDEYRRAGRILVPTANHHLFLLLTAKAGEKWIALLGKRQRHFPFFKTQFENATFYHCNEKKLYHVSGPSLPSLEFECGGPQKGKTVWHIRGDQPFPFSLRLRPVALDRRGIFLKRWLPGVSRWIPGALFRYHLLRMEPGGNLLGGDPVTALHGFSEQGSYAMLTLSDWQVPFHYRLLLEADGQGGSLVWKAAQKKPGNLLETIPHLVGKTFLKDRLSWGVLKPDWNPLRAKILATTQIPLGEWTLQRKIVEGEDPRRNVWYGLEEDFVSGFSPADSPSRSVF